MNKITLNDLYNMGDVLAGKIEEVRDEIPDVPSDYQELADEVSEMLDDITDLKSAISDISGTTINIDMGEWVANSYVKTDGDFNTYTGWHRTGYVSIPSEAKTIHFENTENAANTYNCFYDSEHHKVGTTFNTNNKDVEVPNGAVYFAVSLASSYTVTAKVVIEPLIDKASTTYVDSVAKQADRRLCNIYKYSIPSYWLESNSPASLYLSDKIELIKALPTPQMIFWTDMHWSSNKKYTQYIVPFLSDYCGIDIVVNGGDIINQEASSALGEIKYRSFADLMKYTYKQGYRYVFGNHDLNTANASSYPDTPITDLALTYAFNYQQSIQPWETELIFENISSSDEELIAWNKMHYYWDDEVNKIRYFVLNTGNTYQPLSASLNGASGNAEIYLQIPYLYNAIMSLTDGWSLMVLGHQFFNDNSNDPIPAARSVARMLNAAQLKTTCTLGGNAYQYISNTWDLTACKNIKIIGMWCGHDHSDGSCVFTGTDTSSTFVAGATDASALGSMLLVKTTTDAINTTHTGTTMTEGTTTEQAFDVIGIDTQNKTINTVRIGAGSNRLFKF